MGNDVWEASLGKRWTDVDIRARACGLRPYQHELILLAFGNRRLRAESSEAQLALRLGRHHLDIVELGRGILRLVEVSQRVKQHALVLHAVADRVAHPRRRRDRDERAVEDGQDRCAPHLARRQRGALPLFAPLPLRLQHPEEVPRRHHLQPRDGRHQRGRLLVGDVHLDRRDGELGHHRMRPRAR